MLPDSPGRLSQMSYSATGESRFLTGLDARFGMTAFV
jgi:hypothetical protein